MLAGAICGSADFINNTLLPFQRNTGPTLSPFNAWVVLKGMETLGIRMEAQSARALALAQAGDCSNAVLAHSCSANCRFYSQWEK